MSKRSKIQQRRLEELEQEFVPLLLACLDECRRGRWGLFGVYDNIDPEGKWWPEASRLKELANAIQILESEVGAANPLCERFLRLRSVRGPNVLGEPKRAANLLKEVKEGL